MKKHKHSLKYYIKYFSTVITWSIFVILMVLAIFLGYYFVSLKIYEVKGEDYKPPFSIYTIVSPSMVPTINVYDVIVNFKVDSPEAIKKGDVITFISTSSISMGKTITHRVYSVLGLNQDGEYEYETKGDNNLVKDSMPASYSKLIGKTILRIPKVGYAQYFLASGTGWILIVVLPSLIVIIKDSLKLVKLTKMKKIAQLANLEMIMEDKKKGIFPEDEEEKIIIK